MTEIVQIGKRKFIIWMVGSFQLSILKGLGCIGDAAFQVTFGTLTVAVVIGYATEYFAKK